MEAMIVSEFYNNDNACERVNTALMWKIRDSRRLTNGSQELPRIHLVEYYIETPLLALIKCEIRRRYRGLDSTLVPNYRYAFD